MDTNKMREDFVAWLKTQPHVLNVGFNKSTGKFVLAEDETAWQAWQASRAAVVVELPEADQLLDYYDAANTNPTFNAEGMREDLVVQLEGLGLRVKP